MSDNEQQFFDELCRGLGVSLLRFPSVCDRLGWAGPAGSIPYLHDGDLPSAIFNDFIRWTQDAPGADAARERLNAVATVWNVDASARVRELASTRSAQSS